MEVTQILRFAIITELRRSRIVSADTLENILHRQGHKIPPRCT